MRLIYQSHVYESVDLSNPIKGGVGDNTVPNMSALVKGAMVEKEHVGDLNDPVNLAKSIDISADHLAESPRYYDEHEKMEKKLENEK